jgi:hypothetical protein
MWTTITDAHILGKSAGGEVAAAREAALADGQTDPVPGIVEQVVREVRAAVATCERNTLGPVGTIPDELLGAALNRIRFECATRLPGGALMDEDRRTANRDALRMIERAAECKVTIEQPDTASPEVIASGASLQVATNNRRVARRSDLRGL